MKPRKKEAFIKNVKFEIEYIYKGKHPHIIARILTPEQNFYIGKKAYLNQIEIEPYLTMPRALNEKGEPRLDLFVFVLISPSDIEYFQDKMIVELTGN